MAAEGEGDLVFSRSRGKETYEGPCPRPVVGMGREESKEELWGWQRVCCRGRSCSDSP